MTVSELADDVVLSPNYTAGRWEVTRLTPHHTAMIGDAWDIANVFKPTSRNASCNYAIGNDGSIVCVVDEDNRAWTSSSYDNDMRAITFEISDCDYDWNISEAAQEAFIELCVDLIRRYPSLGGSFDWTGDMSGNVTVHRWFAATACPGDPLYNMLGRLGDEINRRLQGGGEDDDEVKPEDIQKIVSAMTFIGEPFNNDGTYYKAHVSNIGWQDAIRDGQVAGTQGEGLAIEAIELIPSVQLNVSAHLSYTGWVDYTITPDGGIIGTTGESRPIEALRIDCKEPVRYRVHVAGIGWQGWKRNGELAGTTGESRAIEAFQLVVG